MGNTSRATEDAVRLARNAPLAASVARRHLARGGDHAGSVALRLLGLPASRRRPASDKGPYRAALASLRAGELTDAEAAARASGGMRGRLLAAYVAGELGVLRPEAASRTTPTAPPDRTPPPAEVTRPTGRVLHLVTNALPEVVAGYSVRTHGIALAQREAGVDAQVVTRLGFPVTKGHLRAREYVEVEGVPYHRALGGVLPLRPDEALARDVERTARLVERLRPDVLHAHSNHLNGQVALAVGSRYEIPVVYEVRGFIEETRRSADGTGRSEAWRLTRSAETWCMQQADAVVTLSETMRAEIVRRGIPAAKVTVSPNAVPARFLTADPEEWPLDLPPGTVVAGVVGTLNSYEGVDVLIRAVSRLRGVHLVVVGDGPARPELAALAEGLPVTFVGQVPVDDVPRWHSTIDVYCVPRLDLPVTRLVPPLKPVEAMAAARPVVASDLPPLRELVRPGVTGLLVPPGDVDALAAALAELAAAPGLRRALGDSGRAAVAEHRTWSAAADRYADLYARLRTESPRLITSKQGAPA